MTVGVRVPLSVGQLTAVVRGALAVEPRLEDVLVEGELSNLRNPGSGHLYFTLRDAGAQLRCVCFRSAAARIPFRPEAGMTVIARGRVDVYDADGSYQLYVESLQPAGLGAIALAIEQRRRRLAGEGLFDEGRKRRLPALPRRIAVVTSSTGAAVRDVVIVVRRRHPGVGVVVVPTPVQGEGAEASLVRALTEAQRLPGVDVVLLVRGGGSYEDLVAFQAEAVVRAIVGSRIPVVTGIGHETDTTLADLAADRRGATPSSAAELAVPELRGLRDEVVTRTQRLQGAATAGVAQKRRGLMSTRERLRLASPERRLPALRQGLDGRIAALRAALLAHVAGRRRLLDATTGALRLASPGRRLPVHREALRHREDRHRRAILRTLADHRGRLLGARGRLEALSPLRVLERGYSITTAADGSVLLSADQVAAGNLIRTRLATGEVTSQVTAQS